jgi:hypothetical protein
MARCKEISELGMKLELNSPLPPGSRGALHLAYEDFSFGLSFLVTNSRADIGGIRFIYESDQQRNAVLRLVECLTAAKPCTSLALIG